MPKRRGHNKIAKRILPHIPITLIDAVNKALDQPSKFLGPSHRSMYHDPASASAVGAMVAAKMGYPVSWGVAVANVHLGVDNAFSGVPNPIRTLLVEMAERI